MVPIELRLIFIVKCQLIYRNTKKEWFYARYELQKKSFNSKNIVLWHTQVRPSTCQFHSAAWGSWYNAPWLADDPVMPCWIFVVSVYHGETELPGITFTTNWSTVSVQPTDMHTLLNCLNPQYKVISNREKMRLTRFQDLVLTLEPKITYLTWCLHLQMI